MPSVSFKRSEPPLVLAIDVGTTSVRAELYDRQGRDMRGSPMSAETPLTTSADGAATLDPEKLLDVTIGVIDRALKAATDALGPRASVDAVAISTFWHSFLGVDERNRPTTPLLLWADSRARDEMLQLRAHLDERAVHARTGCLLHWSYWPAKLLWVQSAMPDDWQRTGRLVSFGEFLHLRLLGQAVCGVSMASGTG